VNEWSGSRNRAGPCGESGLPCGLMAERALRAFMSLSLTARLLWLVAALQAFGMIVRLAQ